MPTRAQITTQTEKQTRFLVTSVSDCPLVRHCDYEGQRALGPKGARLAHNEPDVENKLHGLKNRAQMACPTAEDPASEITISLDWVADRVEAKEQPAEHRSTERGGRAKEDVEKHSRDNSDRHDRVWSVEWAENITCGGGRCSARTHHRSWKGHAQVIKKNTVAHPAWRRTRRAFEYSVSDCDRPTKSSSL